MDSCGSTYLTVWMESEAEIATSYIGEPRASHKNHIIIAALYHLYILIQLNREDNFISRNYFNILQISPINRNQNRQFGTSQH